MTKKLSKQLPGSRRNHSTQHCFSCMFEIWKTFLNEGGYTRALVEEGGGEDSSTVTQHQNTVQV